MKHIAEAKKPDPDEKADEVKKMLANWTSWRNFILVPGFIGFILALVLFGTRVGRTITDPIVEALIK